MVYCPECGSEMDQVDIGLYACPRCGDCYVVHVDPEVGSVLAVARLPLSCSRVVGGRA